MRILLLSYCFLVSTAFAADIKESAYVLAFADNSEYLVFSDGEKKGYCPFEWNCQDSVGLSYGVILKGPRKLLSAQGNSLDIALAWPSPNCDVTFYNHSNFAEAVCWKEVDQYSLLKCPLAVTLAPHQLVPPGRYSESFDLELFNTDRVLIGNYKVIITVIVASSQTVELTLAHGANQGKQLVLDFHEASQTQSQSFFCQITSNSPYTVQARSLQGGKLRMNPAWVNPNYRLIEIDYDFTFEGLLVALNENFSTIFTSNKPPMGIKIMHRAEVTIHPDTSKHWEGIYEDEIIFSISSTL